MKKQFWKNKRVFITGFEGFLGSHLSKTLLNSGARLWGLDIKTYRKETILSFKELKKIKVIKGSVENLALLNKIIQENKIEFIFHLAAKALVNACLKNPIRAFATNIKGTWNILETTRKSNNAQAIIIASSDKAYGKSSHLPYKETSPLAGSHPYDVSKSCGDLLAQTYSHSFNLPIGITRCGNVFGPGDFTFSRIVPETIRCALTDKPLLIRSDGWFTRDYIYVEDIIKGYLLLAEKIHKHKLSGEVFNLSLQKPISVLKLVKSIYKLCAKKPSYKILNQAQYEIRNQYLSSAKAKRILGWQPKYTLNGGLKKTIKWYKNMLKKQVTI